MENIYYNLEEIQLLIADGKLYKILAMIDLTNIENSLTLVIPGFNEEKSFSLIQSSEVIISILCKEIPYVISDLLNLVEFPVFYKGFLVMEINNQLSLLKPTARSLDTDLKSLFFHISKKKRAALERLFWLKTQGSFFKVNNLKRRFWCPAREVYRAHLKKVIDYKLSEDVINNETKAIRKHIEIIHYLTDERHKKESLKKLQFNALSISSKIASFSKNNYYPSTFNVNLRPADLVWKNFKMNYLKKVEQKWFEIHYDEQNSLQNFPQKHKIIYSQSNLPSTIYNSSLNFEKKNLSESNDCSDIIAEPSTRKQSTIIRVIGDETRIFWVQEIFSKEKLYENEIALRNVSNVMKEAVFLGKYADCQRYLTKFFASIVENKSFNFAAITTLIIPTKDQEFLLELYEALPPQLQITLRNIFLPENKSLEIIGTIKNEINRRKNTHVLINQWEVILMDVKKTDEQLNLSLKVRPKF